MKVVIDCDDAALELKKVIVRHLETKGVEVTDLDYLGRKKGAFYPEIGYNLACRIKDGSFERGILICGTGLGMANNAQVLTMGARVIGPELAKTIVDAWLVSEFQGGGSQPKVDQMHELERRSFHP